MVDVQDLLSDVFLIYSMLMRTLLELWGLVQSANSRYASVISETNVTDTLASIDRVTLRVYRFRHLIIVKFQLTLCNKSGSTLAHSLSSEKGQISVPPRVW